MNDYTKVAPIELDSPGRPAVGPQPPQNTPLWVLLSVLVQFLGFLICVGCIIAEPETAGEKIVVPIVYGIFFGQVMLAAAATVLTRWNLLLRFTLPPLWLAMEVTIALAFENPNGIRELLVVCGMVVFCWGVVQIPFWIYRWLTKARIQTVENARRLGSQDGQFSLGQMLLFTLIVAVVLGVFRATLELDDVRHFLEISLNEVFIFASFLTSLTLSGLLTIRAGLSAKLNALSLCFALAGVLGMMGFLYVSLQGLTLPGPTHFKFMLVNSVGGVAIWLTISVSALRLTGLRLI